jgi:phosphoribosylanthranilate isomerase
MRTCVKICGITHKEDAQLCAQLGADAVGFIFYRKSPRYIDPAKAKTIIDSLPPFIAPVGVFVNEDRERILQIIQDTGIRAIQLSGDEQPDDCKNYPVKVIKAFRLQDDGDVNPIAAYPISAALLDGAPEGTYGGSGVLASHSVALEMKKYFPLILAGGLTPDNISDALTNVAPYAVDVNSGVEKAPGIKDYEKVQLLFQNINQLEYQSKDT